VKARLLAELRRLVAADYDIEDEIGGGAMSRVVLATERSLNRRVVLKVLPPELGAGVSAERFRREMMTLAHFAHPHIVPILRADSVVGENGVTFLYYVMPYLEGETLRALMERDRQLPVDRAVRLAREIAEALDYAHRHGVIHRDVKPENVLLSDGHALVIDFGVARALTGGAATITGTGVTVGTPSYMSPEQASADRELDGRTDIYSLGCVLFEMLAGASPHAAPSAQQILARRLSGPAPDVRTLRPSTPPELVRIVQRMLELAPEDRFESAASLVAALRAVEALASVGTGAPAIPPVPPPAAPAQPPVAARPSRLWLALGGLAVLAVAAAAWLALQGP
jgi:serine/threonine-protein kinase